MAINVDTVYKTVLLILNKEQRGYITPNEFNRIGTQVQREIFEQYFEELNQQLRVPQNDSEYANRIKNLDEKIDVFKTFNTCTGANPFTLPNNDVVTATLTLAGTGYSTSGVPQATTGGSGTGCTVNITVVGGPAPITSFTIAAGGNGYQIGDVLTISGGGGDATITIDTVSETVHRLGTLIYNVNSKEIQPVQRNEYFLLNKSPLTKPTTEYPVYILEGIGVPTAPPSNVTVFPSTITSNEVDAYYIKAPANTRWGYSIGSLGQYLYDSTTYGASLLNTGDGTLTSSADTAGLTATDTTSPIALTQGAGATGNFALTPVSGPGGTGLEISVSVASNVFTINVTSAGTGYVVGDILAIPATAIPGLSGQIVITFVAADFNSNSTYGSTLFELHPSEQTNLVLQILMYSGVVIRDPSIVQNAAAMVQQDEVLEKS